ncbi:unnamed protein product [Rotaria socialis]|uniref:Uncharacterized protein n=1 Tax=Rotaria socialis TaxID=392032 RepID=A0A821M4X8_9BILA|nr:unnamed protein product [Rotaria socialis]
MGSTISIIIAMLVLAKNRSSAYDVFISTYNGTGFSFAYVCLIGILPTLFSFSGFEAAGHLTEETHEADIKAPKAIAGTCISAACVGCAYLLSSLFAAGSPDYVTENSLNPSATVQIFQTSTPNPVALLFTILLLICLYFAGVSSTTVSSRTCYALGRDSLFPYKKYLCIVHKGTHTPLLLSTTAFAAIVSISTIGFQVSYTIPIFFRITSSRKTFKKGRFNLGKFGYPVTAANMNWSIVVCTGISIFGALYWIFSLRTWYTGPPRMADNSVVTISPGLVITQF